MLRTNNDRVIAVTAWSAIAIVTVLRFAVAVALPLTGDEAYYWEWSKRLGFGYTDHPPMIAWAIALGNPLHLGAFGVRIACVVCGVAATAALFAAGWRAGGRLAGPAAAAAFTLMPLYCVAFTTASPDGPYVFFWCAALWLAIETWERQSWSVAAALGVALGGALLSRVFGIALALGIIAVFLLAADRGVRARGACAALVAAAVFAPFVAWNAAHGWATFAFSVAGRHVNEGFSLMRPLVWLLTLVAAYGFATAIGSFVALFGSRRPLLLWTALPLGGALLALAFIERVELYWAFGPMVSAALAAGIALPAKVAPVRARWTAGAIVSAFPLFALAAVAGLSMPATAHAFTQAAAARLRNSGPFEIFTYAPLAHDVARIARERSAVVMTDGYGFSSLLDFHDGIAPVVIGYDAQGAQAKTWYDPAMQPARALFVDKEPLRSRPDFAQRFDLACEHVKDGGTLVYEYAGVNARTYYLTWCEGMRAGGMRMLRWEKPGA